MIGLLLAGGKSSRLGQPKCLVAFDGRALGRILLDRLALITDRQLIATNDRALTGGWGVPVVGDVFPGRGPLSGIHAALLAAGGDGILALACDLPFFSPDLGRYLCSLAQGYDIVIPRHNSYLEPLCAVYNTGSLHVVEQALKDGRRKVTDILPGLKVRYVDKEDLVRFGPPERLFFNINSPSDLEAVRREWRARPPGALRA